MIRDLSVPRVSPPSVGQKLLARVPASPMSYCMLLLTKPPWPSDQTMSYSLRCIFLTLDLYQRIHTHLYKEVSLKFSELHMGWAYSRLLVNAEWKIIGKKNPTVFGKRCHSQLSLHYFRLCDFEPDSWQFSESNCTKQVALAFLTEPIPHLQR